MSAHAIDSPVFGIIAPERLSGGVKALIIMYKEPSLIVNASACPFEICIQNSGNVIHSYYEFLKEFQEVEIIER